MTLCTMYPSHASCPKDRAHPGVLLSEMPSSGVGFAVCLAAIASLHNWLARSATGEPCQPKMLSLVWIPIAAAALANSGNSRLCDAVDRDTALDGSILRSTHMLIQIRA